MEIGKAQGAQAPLRLLTSREKTLMVLGSHPGSAGHAARQPTGWVVAGMLAGLEVWDRFSRRWRELLSPSLQEGYLAALVASGEVTAIVGALSGAAGEPLASKSEDPTLLRQPYDPPLRCFDHCVLEAARCLNGRPAGEAVSFVMNWADALAPSALWRMEDLKNLADGSLRVRLGALGFESDEDFPPLQAAERLARRCHEWLWDPARDRDLLGCADAPWVRLTLLEGGHLTNIQNSDRAWKPSNSPP
jgi:hypothetical protein